MSKLHANLLCRTYNEFVTSAREMSLPHNGTNIMDDAFEGLKNADGTDIPYVQVIMIILVLL